MNTLVKILLIFILSSGIAYAETEKKVPTIVQSELKALTDDCRGVGGKPKKSPGLLTVADITGDEIPDFVIYQGAFICDGAASIFSGSGGSQMAVYVGTPDRQAFLAFTTGLFDMNIIKSTKPAQLKVVVGGKLCGQKNTENLSHSEMKTCWRPIQWNKSKLKMNFSPVSQVKFIE